MKTIEPVSIWDNGTVRQATILNTYASNVVLGISATFSYFLYFDSQNTMGFQVLSSGSLNMTGEAYQQWQQDSYAWDWIAGQLNLTITGDYIPPVPPEPIVEEEVVVEQPIV